MTIRAGRRRSLQRALFFGALVVLIGPFLLVFVWMIFASFQNALQITSWPPSLVFVPTLDNYAKVLHGLPFGLYTLNSAIVSLSATALGLVVGVPAGYGIARWQHRRLATTILVTRMTPWISFLLPWYILFGWMGLVGSRLSLVLTHLIITVPMSTWLMVGFFEDLPIELEDAALVEGCSRYGVFTRVSVPLVVPGIVASAILSLIFSWNNYIFALILAGSSTRTLPLVVSSFIAYEEVDWGATMAAAILITLPVVALTLGLQRRLVRGLTLGGLKD